MKFHKFALLLTIFMGTSSLTFANEQYDWSKIDGLGLISKKDETYIHKDIWKDTTQASAISLLDRLPHTLTSPQYRELARRLLVSEAPQFDEEIEAPSFLTKRIETLISYGLFEDAIALYNNAKENDEALPDNFELSMIEIQTTLINGSLAPICLDVQAASGVFRDMPAWRELSDFCRLRFGSAEKIKLNDFKFTHFPELKYILENETVNIGSLKSPMGLLVAFSDKNITDENYNDSAKQAYKLPDLAIKLAINDNYKNNETYQCYAIEAAKRGIINGETLKEIYTNTNFSVDLLNNQSGEIALHPCHIPAYFYQRFAKTENGDELEKLLGTLLSVTKTIPPQALLPMVDHLIEHVIGFNNQWQASMIMGANGFVVPETYESNLTPLKTIQKSQLISNDSYKTWLGTDKNAQFLDAGNIDRALLPYISRILSSKNINFEQNSQNNEYENFFSLTYAEKSLHLGLGFNDFIAKTYDDDNHARVIVHLLSLIGHHDVAELAPNDVSVILSGLRAYKLEKEAITLAFEYLQ